MELCPSHFKRALISQIRLLVSEVRRLEPSLVMKLETAKPARLSPLNRIDLQCCRVQLVNNVLEIFHPRPFEVNFTFAFGTEDFKLSHRVADLQEVVLVFRLPPSLSRDVLVHEQEVLIVGLVQSEQFLLPVSDLRIDVSDDCGSIVGQMLCNVGQSAFSENAFVR